AAEIGNSKGYNMVVLGAYLKLRPVVTLDNVIKGLKKSIPERHHSLIPMNEKAIAAGMERLVIHNSL
ncbi:MAG: 2-oxoacid:acceptor oxidoreductase family protein, partial [Bacteroidales bacterium]|nr:2-oxoacid:acceptor oxidoreductase family protein [Bacteroidales bacterium]